MASTAENMIEKRDWAETSAKLRYLFSLRYTKISDKTKSRAL